MDEVAAVSEAGEGGKYRPGEEIIHRTSIALAYDSIYAIAWSNARFDCYLGA